MIRRDRARLRLAVRRKQYVQTYSRFGRDARTRLAIRLAARLARRQASGAQPDPRFPGQREPFRDVCVHEHRERFRRVRRPPMPITLTDDQIEAVRRAAAPLPPAHRQAFLDDVTAALADVPVIGPGIVHRAIVAAQRAHFDPPRFATALSAPRPRSR
jgi:hypothetical protein